MENYSKARRYLRALPRFSLYGAASFSLKTLDRGRTQASLLGLVDNYHHILGITLCATTWGNAQAVDFIEYSIADEKLRSAILTRLPIRMGKNTTSSAHLLWIRLCARILTLFHVIDSKRIYIDA